MSSTFLVLLAMHVALSFLLHRGAGPSRRGPIRLFHMVLQFAIFCIACGYGIRAGVFSRQLISPLYIGLGLLAGHLIFGFSLLATHRNLRDALVHFVDLPTLWEFSTGSPIVLSRFFTVAFAEELIYRVTAQPLLIGLIAGTGVDSGWAVAAGIAVSGLLFSIVHQHFFTNEFWVSIEFVVFAILLGVVYHFTGSFVLVIVIHALRDIEIAYLEYLVKLDELGDKDAAVRAVETAFFRVHHLEQP